MQPSDPRGEMGSRSFPWTKEQVKAYTLANTRTVKLRGQIAARAVAAILLLFARSLSWNAAYRFGSLIGYCLYALKVRRKVAMTNLDIVYGQNKSLKGKNEIYRKSLLNFGHQTVNYLRVPLMDDSFWDNDFELVNEDLLREAYNRGKGVIFLYMHFGPWELPGGKISHAGYPLSVVAKTIPNAVIDKFLVDARSGMTLGTIPHREAMARIKEGLQNGEGVIMVIDQNMKRSQGVFVEWLGRVASTVKSAAWIARETGAAVITGYAVQSGPKKFKMVMTEEIPWASQPDDPTAELVTNTKNYVKAVEKNILKMPEEWFWLHRRWKVQPEGTPNPYKD